MPRSCLCHRLLARVAADAAFRLLPDPVRLLWFDLFAAASAAPVQGRLRFLHSVRSSVARLVSRPETEIATELADLAALGLIDLDADGVTLWLPGAREGSARAEAARRNGLLGGARRKGETSEVRRERRQRELLLTIPGGTEGTEAATQPPNRTDPPLVVVEKKEIIPTSSPDSGDARAPEWVSLGTEVAEIAGLDGGFDVSPVQAWLKKPITPEQIRAAVREVVSKPGYDARKVYTLKYFGPAVERAAERVVPAAPAPRTAEQVQAELEHLARINARIEATLASVSRMRAA